MGVLFDFEKLIEPVTTRQVRDSVYDLLELLGIEVTSWKPGAVVRTMIAGFSTLGASSSQFISTMARSAIFELAEDEWADLHGFYTYGVSRDVETFAAGNVVVSNSSGTPFAYSPGQLVVRNSTTNKTYSNTVAVTIPASSPGTTVAVVADEGGSASTSVAGAIDAIASGAASLSVTNAAAIVGTDDESIDDYKNRCKLRTGALSPNGPRDAYGYVARSAKRIDETPIGVTRAVTIPDGIWGVDTYCANASGGISGTQDDTTTDLGRIHLDIVKWATPHGITPRTHSATEKSVTVQYNAFVYSSTGLNNAELLTKIETALAQHFATIPIGGDAAEVGSNRVYADAIRRVIAAQDADIFHVELDPNEDILLGRFEVATLAAVLGQLTVLPRPTSV